MPCVWVFPFIHDIKNTFRLAILFATAVKNFKTRPTLQNTAHGPGTSRFLWEHGTALSMRPLAQFTRKRMRFASLKVLQMTVLKPDVIHGSSLYSGLLRPLKIFIIKRYEKTYRKDLLHPSLKNDLFWVFRGLFIPVIHRTPVGRRAAVTCVPSQGTLCCSLLGPRHCSFCSQPQTVRATGAHHITAWLGVCACLPSFCAIVFQGNQTTTDHFFYKAHFSPVGWEHGKMKEVRTRRGETPR